MFKLVEVISSSSSRFFALKKRVQDFRENLRHVKNTSKPIFKDFNLRDDSSKSMIVYGICPHQGNTESRKNLRGIRGNLSARHLGSPWDQSRFVFSPITNSLLHSLRTHLATILHFALIIAKSQNISPTNIT